MNLDPKKVSDIIERFETIANQQLSTLIPDARALSAQMFWYANLLGDVGNDFRKTYVNRKTLYSELVKRYKSQGQNVSEAKESAQCDKEHVEVRLKESELESRYEKGKLMFKAIEHVLSRMNQEIAELRKDQRLHDYANQQNNRRT